MLLFSKWSQLVKTTVILLLSDSLDELVGASGQGQLGWSLQTAGGPSKAGWSQIDLLCCLPIGLGLGWLQLRLCVSVPVVSWPLLFLAWRSLPGGFQISKLTRQYKPLHPSAYISLSLHHVCWCLFGQSKCGQAQFQRVEKSICALDERSRKPPFQGVCDSERRSWWPFAIFHMR